MKVLRNLRSGESRLIFMNRTGMLNVTVCNFSFCEGLEGRLGVISAGRSAKSFLWMFLSDLWNACMEWRAVSHVTCRWLQERRCCPISLLHGQSWGEITLRQGRHAADGNFSAVCQLVSVSCLLSLIFVQWLFLGESGKFWCQKYHYD